MEYLGSAYAGFQRQGERKTVQLTLERAISAVTQEDVRVVGSGRTDAGAHAIGQVIAFSTESALPPEVLCRAINAHLPFDIAVTSVADVEPDFHPRHGASSRTYRYLIWNRQIRSPLWIGRAAHIKARLDERAMDEAAQLLVGRHDFGAFVPTAQQGSRERAMDSTSCRRDGHLVIVDLTATGFMRQMVRALVGTLVRVGMGAIGAADFQRILCSRDRSRAGVTMPACGLYLLGVQFGPSSLVQGGMTKSTIEALDESALHIEEMI